ncbi:MAG: hypothetical protein FWH11_11605 [Micrococcales bacterium]|nr:hypothetical protein [Micrococcales bacterium]
MADAEAARADLDRVRAQAAEQAHGAWQCLLHDEVAVAFRAAATPGVGRLEVRRCARQALAAIEDLADPVADGPADLMPALRDIATAPTRTVELDGPDALVVPASAAAAILGAVVESVRNVERHAPGARARVQVGCDGAVTTVRVVDDGPGFRPTRSPQGGLRVSVAAPLARVGGAARVDSTPGQGTVVTLVWPTTTLVRGTTGPLAAVWRAVRDEVHTRRRARLGEIVVPFLHRLADADSRVDDAVRAEAELAEQAVRDEMHLPEVLDGPTRQTVRAARAQGCRVRLQSDSATGVPVTPVGSTAQVNAVVQVALSAPPVPRELTLSVYASAAGQVRVAVVAVPGSPARRDALHRAFADRVDTLTDDADATWAEIWVSG